MPRRTWPRKLLASDKLRGRFVSCALGDAACVGSNIEAAGLRLFRRPLEADELQTYQRVYDAARQLGDDDPTALALTLQALLSSAEFLYRIEVDPQPESTEAHPLGSFELASRLSYFLWSSAPDDPLLEAAADGSLTQPATLSAVVDRMLDDPRSERLVANFAGQWLGARDVLSHPVASKFYEWSPQMAHAASQEILLYFSDFLKSGRSWFEFPKADVNFVDVALAYFYGIPTTSPDVGIFERVEYHDDRRAGFFGLAGFLAVSSFDRRTSPSRRGRWIASNLLCTDPPPPPPNVPKLEPEEQDAGDSSKLNVRQTLEQHRKSPGCAACHALFDAYGLALEEYDAIGLYRTTYEDGSPVDVSVTFPASDTHPAGETFEGLDGLSQAVSTDPHFGECLARKLFTYGLGRTHDGQRRAPLAARSRGVARPWADAEHSPPDPRARSPAKPFAFVEAEDEMRHDESLRLSTGVAAWRGRGARAAVARIAHNPDPRARKRPTSPGDFCPFTYRTALTSSGVPQRAGAATLGSFLRCSSHSAPRSSRSSTS